MNTEKIKIFLCEDDESLGMMLKEYMQARGYLVDLFTDGEMATQNFPSKQYDICLIDVMMPKKDGFAVAQEIRKVNDTIPIIFVTAKDQKEDILHGFSIGADDYISKPFSIQELEARFEAIMRRIRGRKHETLQFYQLGKFLFDTKKQTLTIDDKVISLTTKENELLALFCAYANETLERNFALKTVWVDANYFNARSMDVYVTKLRKILKADPSLEIKNVHGKGYRLITPLSSVDESQIKHI